MLVIESKFDLGEVFLTPSIVGMQERGKVDIRSLLTRYCQCDWGDTSKSVECETSDWQLNDEAIERGERIVAFYEIEQGVRIMVETDYARVATVVRLASEY